LKREDLRNKRKRDREGQATKTGLPSGKSHRKGKRLRVKRTSSSAERGEERKGPSISACSIIRSAGRSASTKGPRRAKETQVVQKKIREEGGVREEGIQCTKGLEEANLRAKHYSLKDERKKKKGKPIDNAFYE